jgi:uncharacterized membrane protein
MIKYWLADRWRLLVLAIVAATVVWRLVTLSARPLWFDEAFTWQMVQFPWGEMLERLRQDFNPPFYYVLLKLWTSVLGDSVFALRLLSVAWFVGTLAGAFLLCREVERGCRLTTTARRDAVGLMALLLFAASPFVLRYSQEARMYGQTTALSLLSSWLLLRALREQACPGRWWLAYGLTAAGLAYTHTYALFSVATQVVFLAGVFALKARGNPGRLWRDTRFRWACVAGGLLALLYLPWIPTLLQQRERACLDYWAMPVDACSSASGRLGFVFFLLLRCVLFLKPTPAPVLVALGLLVPLALVLQRLALSFERGRVYLALGALGPVALTVVVSHNLGRLVATERYYLPAFALLLAGVAVELAYLKAPGARWGLAGAGFAVLAAASWQFWGSLDLPAHPAYRGVADHIAAQSRAGDAVVVMNPLAFFPLKYHARNRFPVYQLQAAQPFHTWEGTAALPATDWLAWEEWPPCHCSRVWVVTVAVWHRPAKANAPIPATWLRRAECRFDEDFLEWSCEVILTLWEVQETADSPSSQTVPW